jgi:hypothetical protein
MDPSCPPVATPTPATQQTVTTINTIADAYREDVAADVAAVAAVTVPEPVQEIASVTTPVVTASVPEQVTAIQVTETPKETAPAPERLSPEQVAALSAIQSMANESAQQAGLSPEAAQAASSAIGNQSFGSVAATAVQATTSSSAANSSSDINSPSSPTSQANTNEVLAMSNGVTPTASAPQTDQQQPSATGQQDDFAVMSASPGFAAYTQVSLQDRPDFYAIRDIYKNRRLRDANFEMYRMVKTNDVAWQEMTDAQYRQ